MKRSEINKVIKEMEALTKKFSFSLPPFCNWTPEEWENKNHEYDEIRDNMLGWDITDFGLGDFDKIGFGLITIRNGNQNDPKYKKVYAEKLLMLRDGQTAPYHYHVFKSEDIINRGGGTLVITMYESNPDGSLSDKDVLINTDGRSYYANPGNGIVLQVMDSDDPGNPTGYYAEPEAADEPMEDRDLLTAKAGTDVILKPGESVTLWPYQYHHFAVVPGTGTVLIGEVSRCNDDNKDNYFLEKIGRFPKIEEDEKPYRLLCNEYPAAKD